MKINDIDLAENSIANTHYHLEQALEELDNLMQGEPELMATYFGRKLQTRRNELKKMLDEVQSVGRSLTARQADGKNYCDADPAVSMCWTHGCEPCPYTKGVFCPPVERKK